MLESLTGAASAARTLALAAGADAIAERRAAHVDDAARIAARLFVEKPNALRRRLATMWAVGR